MTPFQQKTYVLLKQVPAGKVTTYKAIADALGTRAYRAIGQYMKHNPYAPTVPCHRVVASDGSIGGFMGKTSGPEIAKKIALLQKEGIIICNNRIQNFDHVQHVFKDLV
jgi:methylated-DNA-[protein]-cysteine S-methyltransferase